VEETLENPEERPANSPALSESVTKPNAEDERWDKPRVSRAVAPEESPPRQCRESKSRRNRVRFSGRHL